MKNKNSKRIYIIGIGGKGLNSIAHFCKAKGYSVSGSDNRASSETDSLIQNKIEVFFDQSGIHVNPDYDIVVYSSIVKAHHPERERARELGIRQLSRAQFLKYITKEFIRISVAGSHGKSTTSALASLLVQAQTGSVNSIIGAHIKEKNAYYISEESPYCVVEACEYAKSFLHLPGEYTLITSLEKSHMEYFQNEESMNYAFEEFVQKHSDISTLIINGDNPVLRSICSKHKGAVIKCGFNSSNDFSIKNVRLEKDHSVFDVYFEDKILFENIYIKIPGLYNILNTTLVLALLYKMNYTDINSTQKILNTFTGVGRRFEQVVSDKVTIIDDFAHHPTQVKQLISSIKQFYPNKEIVAVFEPRHCHLFKTFLKEYGHAFKDVHEVYITDIVPALGDTQEDISAISTQDVLQSVQTYSKPNKVWYARSYQEIVDALSLKNLKDVVIATIGAGSIFQVKELLLHKVQ